MRGHASSLRIYAAALLVSSLPFLPRDARAQESGGNRSTYVRVLDYPTEEPIPGVEVTINGQKLTTDAQGEIPVFPRKGGKRSRSRLTLSHPDYFCDFTENPKIGSDLNLLLLPNDRVLVARGKVRFAETTGEDREVVVGVFVRNMAIAEDQPDYMRWELAASDNRDSSIARRKKIEDRRYETVGLFRTGLGKESLTTVVAGEAFAIPFLEMSPGPDKEYRLIASAPGVGFAETTLSPDDLKEIELTLKPEGGIVVGGQLVDHEGQVVAGAEIECEISYASTQTDAEGRFAFPHCWPQLLYLDIDPGRTTKEGKEPRVDSIYENDRRTGSYSYAGAWDALVLIGYPKGERSTYVQPLEEEDIGDLDDPWSATEYERRAFAALAKADMEAAAEAFARNTLMNTTDSRSNNLANEAFCRLALGQTQDAVRLIKEARHLTPLSPYVALIQGWVGRLSGNLDMAKEAFAHGTALDPTDAYLALGYALLPLEKAGDLAGLLAAAGDAPGNQALQPLFAAITDPTSDLVANVDSLLRKQAETEEPSPNMKATDILFYSAQALFLRGETERATALLEPALAEKDTGSIEFFLGQAQMQVWKGTSKPSPKLVSDESLEQVLLDFESRPLDTVFNGPQGGLSAVGVPLPPELVLPGSVTNGPGGQAVRIQTPAKGFLYTRSGILPENLAGTESLSMWIQAEKGSMKEPLTFEVQFIEKGGKARFWRKVTISEGALSPSGWVKITIPLRYMRHGGNRIPSWKNVKYLGLNFRTGADILLDQLTLLSGTGTGAVIPTEELARLAFPETDLNEVQIEENADFILLSNAKDLKLDALTVRMHEFLSAPKRDLKQVPTRAYDSPPVTIIFATQQEYRAFSPRLAKTLVAVASPPTSGGYTLHSVATSYWKPELGTQRPVYFHEMLHAFVDNHYALPSGQGDGLQEGLANYFQFNMFPQDNLGDSILEGVKKPSYRLPLAKLCNGQRIPMNRYWQALSVTAMLIEDEAYSDKLPALMDAVATQANSDLRPLVTEVLGVTMEKFEQDWLTFAQAYGKELKNASKIHP